MFKMAEKNKLTDDEIEQLADFSLESEALSGHLFWLNRRMRKVASSR